MSDKQDQSTTDAVEILDRRYFRGKPEMQALLAEEEANAEVARKIYDLRTQAGLSQVTGCSFGVCLSGDLRFRGAVDPQLGLGKIDLIIPHDPETVRVGAYVSEKAFIRQFPKSGLGQQRRTVVDACPSVRKVYPETPPRKRLDGLDSWKRFHHDFTPSQVDRLPSIPMGRD
jgi:hypothetical protein